MYVLFSFPYSSLFLKYPVWHSIFVTYHAPGLINCFRDEIDVTWSSIFRRESESFGKVACTAYFFSTSRQFPRAFN